MSQQPEQLGLDEVVDLPQALPVRQRTHHFTGKVVDLWTDQVDLGEGEVVERDYLHHPGAVAILALDTTNEVPQVLLVRQYRHPVASFLWEIPAGLLDVQAEDLQQAAARELYEEAGLTAAEWAVLTDFYNTPGCSDEKVRVFLARNLQAVPEEQRHLGQAEERQMLTGWLPLPEAMQAVTSARVHNPATVIGVLAGYVAWQNDWSTLLPIDHPWQQPGHHWQDHWQRRSAWANQRK